MKRFLLIVFILFPMLLSAQNLVPVQHKNGKWGFKESEYSEKFVIKPKFEHAHPFTGDYAFVCKKGLWGIIGKDGKFVVAPKYSSASKPYNGVTIVQLGSKYDLIKDGKIIVETKYKDVLDLQNNTFAVYSDKFEFVNSEGKVVEQPNNVLLYTSKDGKAIDRSRGYYGDYCWQVDVVSNTYWNGQGIMVFDKPITSIGENAFRYCHGLTNITIPNSVTSIGADAFYYCDGLTSITIPNSVTSIGEEAFCKCSSLTSVTIGDSVTSIGKWAFYDCYCPRVNVNISDLARYCTPNPIHSIIHSSISGEKHLYLNGKEITNLVIPNNVTSIGNNAFYNCDGLTSITIPNSVTWIGDYAFHDCDGLTSITIPNSVTSIGKSAFSSCRSLTRVTIGDSVTSIGSGAFAYCYGLTSITIPNSVTSIGKSTFSSCRSLTRVTIGDSVTSIGDYAFRDCSSLTSITIPNSVTSIGNHAFDGCDRLTRVNVNISDLARYCTSNLTYRFPGERHLYLNGEEITNLVIPNSVTEIGNSAFSGCSSLTSITIPNSVTSIGYDAFAGCENLIKANFQRATPPSMGGSVFENVSGDFKIYVPKGVLDAYESGDWPMDYKCLIVGFRISKIPANQIITYTTTDGCEISANDGYCAHILSSSNLYLHTYENGVGKLIFKDSVTEIAKQAFYGCENLKSITIPNSVTWIGDNAFYDCTSLKAVYLDATIPPYLGEDVFDYYGGRICCPIYVPSSSLSRYKGVGGNWWDYNRYIRGR